jgi:hypothetical protein
VSLSGTQEDFCSMEPTDRLQRDWMWQFF